MLTQVLSSHILGKDIFNIVQVGGGNCITGKQKFTEIPHISKELPLAPFLLQTLLLLLLHCSIQGYPEKKETPSKNSYSYKI